MSLFYGFMSNRMLLMAGLMAVSASFQAVAEGASAGECWALPRVSVACVREAPGHASELGSQVVMGTPVRVLESHGAWNKVETPEGYRGFVIDNSLQMLSDGEMDAWRKSPRLIVTSPEQTYVYSFADTTMMSKRVSDVVNGVVLELAQPDAVENGCRKVRLPDGRTGYISARAVARLDEWGMRRCDKDAVLDFAYRLMGTPYLWGGTSTKSMDCSGLTKIGYFSQGVILPRNASQQAHVGVEIDKDDLSAFMAGDLLLFGNPASGKVNHVGLYIGDGRFIHCSGQVKVNSLRENDADFTPVDLLFVRRLTDDDMLEMGVSSHSWYF